MGTWLQDFLTHLVSVASVVAGVVWLGRALAQRFFDRDLERFRAELSRAAIEHEILLSQLHDRRARAIEDVYCAVLDLEDAVAKFVQPLRFQGDPMPEEQVKDVAPLAEKVRQQLRKARIYFSPETAERIATCYQTLVESANTMAVNYTLPSDMRDQGREMTSWIEASKRFREEAPKVRAALEEDFRGLLGVSSRRHST